MKARYYDLAHPFEMIVDENKIVAVKHIMLDPQRDGKRALVYLWDYIDPALLVANPDRFRYLAETNGATLLLPLAVAIKLVTALTTESERRTTPIGE
jgi:hypothetical protein